MDSQVLCYGGICIDNIIHVPYMPTAGVATTPIQQHYQLGGGATQTAIWLANWGIPVSLTGNAIGKDSYGDKVIKSLKQYPSLSIDAIQQLNTIETPYTRAIIPPNGDRYLIEFGYDTAPMHNSKQIDLSNIQILTVNYYYNNPERESEKVAQLAHASGVKVVASDVLDEQNGFFGASDILINSKAVMNKIMPDIDHLAYTQSIQAKHGGTILLTDGENAVWVFKQDDTHFHIAVPQVKVNDTTGAGDAFRAGIIYGELMKWTIEESTKLAVAAGTLQVQRNAATTPSASLEDAQALANTLRVIRS